MDDLLGSLIKPHTVIVRWLNWGQYRLEKDQGSPVEGVRPCPVGAVRTFVSIYFLLFKQFDCICVNYVNLFSVIYYMNCMC